MDQKNNEDQLIVTPGMVINAKKTSEKNPQNTPKIENLTKSDVAGVQDVSGEDFSEAKVASGKKSRIETRMEIRASARDSLMKSASRQATVPEPPPVARSLTEELTLSPSSYCGKEVDAAFASAVKLKQEGNLEEALKGFNQVLIMDPNRVEAYNYMAEALRKQGKLDAAITSFKRSLSMRPEDAIIQSTLSDVLRQAGQFGPALVASQKAMKMAPNSPKAAYNMALVLRDLGQASSAVSCFEKALSLKPDMVDCRYDHALSLLRIGLYKKGFHEFEWRWKLPGNSPRKFTQPMWDGGDLKGKTILIHCEETLGDMIQFARYVFIVKDRGANVVVECQPELLRLFFALPGADTVILAGDKQPYFDVYAPILSLPRILGTTIKTILGNVPYLRPLDNHNIKLSAPKGTRMKIGIVWSGRAENTYNQHRSCRLEHFLALMNRPDIAFYSLQKGCAVRQISENSCESFLVNLGDSLSDFADTAAVISQLDLVITVDTAVAHLAGAMGHAVWVLLPFSAGWRWGAETSTSPWYPGDLLFRQSHPGHWEDVFSEVEKALKERITALNVQVG